MMPTFTLYRVPVGRAEATPMAGVGAGLMALGVMTLTAAPVTTQDVLGRRARGFRHVNAALMFERVLITVICAEFAEHVLRLLRNRMPARTVAGLPLADVRRRALATLGGGTTETLLGALADRSLS